MKFKGFGLMKSSPGFTMDNHIGPLDFSTSAKGSVKAELGAVHVKIGEIPVKMRIPFLKRRHHHLIEIGSLGGVTLSMDPVALKLDEINLALHGTLGQREKGVNVHSELKVACETQMEAAGTVAGAMKLGSIDLGEEHEMEMPGKDAPHGRPGPKKR